MTGFLKSVGKFVAAGLVAGIAVDQLDKAFPDLKNTFGAENAEFTKLGAGLAVGGSLMYGLDTLIK